MQMLLVARVSSAHPAVFRMGQQDSTTSSRSVWGRGEGREAKPQSRARATQRWLSEGQDGAERGGTRMDIETGNAGAAIRGYQRQENGQGRSVRLELGVGVGIWILEFCRKAPSSLECDQSQNPDLGLAWLLDMRDRPSLNQNQSMNQSTITNRPANEPTSQPASAPSIARQTDGTSEHHLRSPRNATFCACARRAGRQPAPITGFDLHSVDNRTPQDLPRAAHLSAWRSLGLPRSRRCLGILAHREPSLAAPARNFYELESFPASEHAGPGPDGTRILLERQSPGSPR